MNSSGPSLRSLTDFSHLPEQTRAHLVKVYGTLCCMVAASSIGSYIHYYNLFFLQGGIMPLILSIGSILGLTFMNPDTKNFNIRATLLFVFSISQGLVLGSLVAQAINFHPGVITIALASTTIVFASFSLSALMSQRRSFLYLGGLLGSALSLLSLLSFFNAFLSNNYVHSFNLYAGLMLFAGYVIYDTQLIVEKSAQGDFDVIQHSLCLFTDLVPIFVRILIILMNKDENKRKSKRKD